MVKTAKSGRVRLSPEREAELADLAEGIIDAHCPDGRIDPEAIIRAKGIALCFDHYEDAFDGLIEYEAGRFFIHCNLDRENWPGSPRGRFTLAHELGHYFIDEHRNNLASGQVNPHPSFSDRGNANLLVEREADFFASRLLVPAARFASAAKKAQPKLDGIIAIATQFEVSVSCAAIRCAAAEVFPCVLIKWSDDGLGWKWCSRKFWNLGYRKTIESLGELPHGSATATCVGDATITALIERGTTASFWFPFVQDNSVWNIVLREEAIRLGRFGTLTVLSLHEKDFPKSVVTARGRELQLEEC